MRPILGGGILLAACAGAYLTVTHLRRPPPSPAPDMHSGSIVILAPNMHGCRHLELQPSRHLMLAAQRLAAQLRQNASDIAHAPMLDKQTILHPENVAGGEMQRLAGRRDAEIGAVVRAGIDETRSDMIFVGHDDFDGDFQIRQPGEPRLEESDGALLRTDVGGRRRRGGADLVIDVIVGEQRRKGIHIMCAQSRRELLGKRLRRCVGLGERGLNETSGEKKTGSGDLSAIWHRDLREGTGRAYHKAPKPYIRISGAVSSARRKTPVIVTVFGWSGRGSKGISQRV
jgi:hypothetical protein